MSFILNKTQLFSLIYIGVPLSSTIGWRFVYLSKLFSANLIESI